MTETRERYDSEHAPDRAKSSALEQALRKLEKAKAALKQYANHANWRSPMCYGDRWNDQFQACEQGWEIAEIALKELDDA